MILKFYPKWKMFILGIFTIISNMENAVFAIIAGTLITFATKRNLYGFSRFCMFSIISLTIVYVALFIVNYLKADCIKCVNKKIRLNILYGVLNSLNCSKQGLNFLTNDFKQLETKRFQTQLDMMSSVCNLIISLTFSFIINWKISALFLIGTLIPMIVTIFIQKPIKKASKKWSFFNSKYTNQIASFIKNPFIIRLYDAINLFVNKNKKRVDELENSLFKMNCINLEGNALVNLSGTIFSLLIPFIVGIILVVKGETTLGKFFAIFQLANSFVSPIIGLLNGFSSLSTTKHIIKNVNNMLKNNYSKKSISEHFDSKEIINIKIDNLELPHTKKIINQNIHTGNKVAIIGESGTGKTTFLREILNKDNYINNKFYISSTKKVTYENYEDLFSYVKQTPAIFSADLRFNLTLGKKLPDELINNVCKDLNLSDLIKNKGWDYQLNSTDDKLSGGQLQRISLARAVLMNRPILLLDEVNSSLDKKNSKIIHDYIFSLDKTVFEVIHHYNNDELSRYDVVIDLDK